MKKPLAVSLALVVSLSMAGLAGCQATTPATTAAGGTSTGTVLPVNSNPIVNTSTAPGLTIVSAAAENNVDPVTKAPIADRLQLTVRNSTAAALTKFEIYYVMKDVTTGKSEAYYLPLTGFTLPANSEATIYFDGKTGAGHFPENQFSLYRSSKNQVNFTIELSAAGVQIANATAVKSPGTGEVVGG